MANAATSDLQKSEAQIEKLWETITDMEAPLNEMSDFIMSMWWITQGRNDEVTSPLSTIALTADDLCKKIEAMRGECFHMLHGMKFRERIPASKDDAYLIDLGEQLSKSYKQQVVNAEAPDAEYDASFDASTAIVSKIENATATTLEGLKVKVKAYLWSRGELNFDDYKNEKTTDMRLIGSIFTDLQKIGGAA